MCRAHAGIGSPAKRLRGRLRDAGTGRGATASTPDFGARARIIGEWRAIAEDDGPFAAAMLWRG